MNPRGVETANVLYGGQGASLYQGHESQPEGRGLQPVLVEHAFQQPRLRRRDGEAILAVPGSRKAQGGFMSAGGKEMQPS